MINKLFILFSLRSFHFAFFNPYLLYCNLVWGETYSSHLDPLVKLQNL